MGSRRHLYPNLCDIGDTRMGCALQECRLVEVNVLQTHGVACTTDVSNNLAFMVHHCMPYLHHSAHGNGLALHVKGTFLPSAFHNGSINGKKHAKV